MAPFEQAGRQACGSAATCERRESEGIKSGTQAVRAGAALFRHCPSERPYIHMIAHRLCVNPSRGRIARHTPEAPIYHGVEREPRTRMLATPQAERDVGSATAFACRRSRTDVEAAAPLACWRCGVFAHDSFRRMKHFR